MKKQNLIMDLEILKISYFWIMFYQLKKFSKLVLLKVHHFAITYNFINRGRKEAI